MFNERCAEWVIYAPKAYVNVFFLFSLVSIAFIQGMFMLQRNYIVFAVTIVFYRTIVVELHMGLPRFIKHYQDDVNKLKIYNGNLSIWREELIHLRTSLCKNQRTQEMKIFNPLQILHAVKHSGGCTKIPFLKVAALLLPW